MVENIVSIKLPADEELTIKKNRLKGAVEDSGKRIAVVTGIHGDELEGQYVCYELVRRITANTSRLKGVVDIYPSINPLGMESVTRAVPMSGLDMNKVFPGSDMGAIAENVAAKLVADIKGADICIDIHASNIFIREVPQVRISRDNSDMLLKYARLLNTDFVWVHNSNAVGEGSLADTLNKNGVPTLVVEMGVGQRITKSYCSQLLTGIFNLMSTMGMWTDGQGMVDAVSHPMVSTDGSVRVIHAEQSGIFIPSAEHNMWVQRGTVIGEIVTPISGTVEQEIIAPADGLIFSLREYPIVYEGSVIARILSMGEEEI
ncbi:MAG: succinylglutamate desuccinylase/aspartoacylase family protein [Oscillospiraceae bacterium]|nr:succinylglutamate desuccinylase/aspartoacylase family protein [Oscillospiraceae bacterium]